MDLGINGWLRMRLTSATTSAALSFIVRPVNELTFHRSGALPDIAKAIGSELRGLEATGQEVPHHLVGEEQHAAVGVMNDEELTRAEQLVGDDQGAERVIAGASSGVANDVGISLSARRTWQDPDGRPCTLES
jgi:hypothetical protein